MPKKEVLDVLLEHFEAFVNDPVEYTTESFLTYDATHAISCWLIYSVFMLFFIPILRYITLKFVRLILPINRGKLPDELVPKNKLRTVMTFINGVWTLIMWGAYPTMYRESGPLFLCYWAYALQCVFFLFTAFPRYRSLVRFGMSFIVWPVHSTAVMANFGYVFYGIIFFRWEYELVHFAPPIFLWLFMLTNMHEYDDDVNYLTKGYWSTTWGLLSGVFLTMLYQQLSQPVEVYKNEMRYMFLFATVGVSLAEYISMVVWSIARGIWLRYFAEEKVRQFYWGNEITKKTE
jgi:hypothetical protein